MGMLLDAAVQANVEHEFRHPGSWNKPFAEVDLRFCEYVDFLREHCTQRERDLVVVSENLCRVWKTWHIGVQTLNESLNEADIKELNLLKNALIRLDLIHLLMDGLTKKTVRKMNTVFEMDT